jgi:uncharacterized protein involved in type VI secretion and phage assembly
LTVGSQSIGGEHAPVRFDARLNPRPTAPGPMSAIVVGPDELWSDVLGCIKIRFHWQ